MWSPRFQAPFAASVLLLAALATGGCQEADTALVLDVVGSVPEGRTLFFRLVDDNGPRNAVNQVGDDTHPLELPATLSISTAPKLLGAVVWITNASGAIIAYGTTPVCFAIKPHVLTHRQIELMAAPAGWSPDATNDCRCDATAPDAPMCPGPTPAVDAGVPVDGPAPMRDASTDTASARDAGADQPGDMDDAPVDRAGIDVADAPRLDAAPPAADAAPPAPDKAADKSPDLSAPDKAAPDAAPEAGVKNDGPSGPGVLFGFENVAADWKSAETTLTSDTQTFTQGKGSLRFTKSGRVFLRSRLFDTDEIGSMTPTTKLAVDIFISQAQPIDGSVQLYFQCISIGLEDEFLGYQSIAAGQGGVWRTLTFPVQAAVVAAFANHSRGCEIWFEHFGSGLFRYDHLAFVN